MLKVTLAVFGLALAVSARAEELSSLRVDASSDGAFKRSLASFKEVLSPEQRQAFGEALKDIWIAGADAAQAARDEYTARDYYRQIDGLSYEEVVRYTTGESAKLRDRQSFVASTDAPAPNVRSSSGYQRPSPWHNVPPQPPVWQPRGGTPLFGVPGQR